MGRGSWDLNLVCRLFVNGILLFRGCKNLHQFAARHVFGCFFAYIYLASQDFKNLTSIRNVQHNIRILVSKSWKELCVIVILCGYLARCFVSFTIEVVTLCISLLLLVTPLLTTKTPLTSRRQWLPPLVSVESYKSLAQQRFHQFEAEQRTKGLLVPRFKNEYRRVRRLLDELKFERLPKGARRVRLSEFQGTALRYDWLVAIVRSSGENAFTWGWGTLVVHTELLKRDDCVVQGVFAHEIGHMMCRHVDEHVPVLSVLRRCLRAASTRTDLKEFQVALSVLEMSYSREQENEADACAVEIMKQKWGDSKRSRSLVRLFSQWAGMHHSTKQLGWQNQALSPYLRTHPTHAYRQRACACRLAGFTPRATKEGLVYRAKYFGWLGLDRFYLGEYYAGFIKLLTWLIWWPLDVWWWSRNLATITHPGDGLKLPDDDAHARRLELRTLRPRDLRKMYRELDGIDSSASDLDELVSEIVHLETKQEAASRSYCCRSSNRVVASSKVPRRRRNACRRRCITVCLGCCGIDRCRRGQRGLGFLKFLLVPTGFGIFWWAYDVVYQWN